MGIGAGRGPKVVGMCKWTETAVDTDELYLLDGLTPFIDQAEDNVGRVIFSRSGFTPRLRSYAGHDDRLTLLNPEDIYARPTARSGAG